MPTKTNPSSLRHRARQMLIALEVPNYRLLFLGRITSNMGRTMRTFARGWMVYELTNSPLRMGIAVSALSWPMLFMPLMGGVLADRVNRKKLLIWTESLLVILWVVVALLITNTQFQWWYFIISAVTSGTIQSFGRPGHEAMIGSVVDRKRLGNAVALDSISQTWPRILGPAIGAALIGAVGVGGLFWLTAGGQLITVATLFFIQWEAKKQKAASKTVGRNLLEALHHLRGETVIMALVMLGIFSSLFAGSYIFLLPIFADSILDAGPQGLGALISTSAMGGALGSVLVLAASSSQRNRGRLLFAIAVAKVVLLIIFSQSTLLLLSLVAMFGLGVAQTVFMVMVTMAMQQLAPEHLRGRIMSLRVVTHGLSPIGVLILGTLAEVQGAASTMLIGAVIYAATVLLMFLSVASLRRFQ